MEPHKRWWKDLRKKFGSNLPFMAYSSMLGRWSVVVFDADLIQTILSAAQRDPVRFPKNYLFIKEIIGDGLVSLEGSAWSRHRRIIQPSFQTNFLKEALESSVPKHCATLISAWKATQGTTIDAFTHLSSVTLDVIGEVAFSHDFGACQTLDVWAKQVACRNAAEHSLETVADPLLQSFNASLKISALTVVLSIMNIVWLDKYLNRKAHHTQVVLNKAVDDIIREARAKNKDDGADGPKQKSLLQLLFDAKDAESSSCPISRKTLSDLELRDETKTFILAGHETTSTWCTWALYALAKYPGVQQKVYEDIATHSSGSTASTAGNPITLEQVDQMHYVTAFMLEVLRLYSPVGMIVRFTSQEEVFHGYTIPAKTRLVIPVHLVHRHPLYWGSNPDDFQPERWLDDQENAKRHKFCFLPFSAGPRNCIGQRFAEMEAKLIVTNIVRAFAIHFAPGFCEREMTFTNFITMKAKPPLKICVQQRS